MISVHTVEGMRITLFGTKMPYSRFIYQSSLAYLNGYGRSRHWHNRSRDLYFNSSCWGFRG